VRVEQVQVGAEGLGRADVGGRADPERLHHLGAGAPRGLGAERGPLVAVKLQDRQLLALGRPDDVLHRGVDEDPRDLAPALQRGPDLLRQVGLDIARALGVMDQPDRPGAQVRRVGGVLDAGHCADLDLGHLSQGSQNHIGFRA
jgi:hypothetical protein